MPATTGATCRTCASAPELDVDALGFRRDLPRGHGPAPTDHRRSGRRTGYAAARIAASFARSSADRRADPTSTSDVDIAGLTLDVVPSSPGPATPTVSEQPPPSGPTPSPAPAWYAGAEVLLECEVRPGESSAGAGSPAISALRRCRRGSRPSRTSWIVCTATDVVVPGRPASASPTRRPTARSTRTRSVAPSEPSSSPDRTKADGSGPWRVTGVAACEPGELGVGPADSVRSPGSGAIPLVRSSPRMP